MTEKENYLPNLSSEERAHALELAIQARRRYAALKARVKSGELTFTDAMDEEDAKRILVTSLLQSVPGIGASKAVVIMRLYRIPKGSCSRQGNRRNRYGAPHKVPRYFSAAARACPHIRWKQNATCIRPLQQFRLPRRHRGDARAHGTRL